MFFTPLLAVAAVLASAVSALNPITSKGSFFFDAVTGDRFYVKGLAYSANYGSAQSSPIAATGSISALDPLANGQGCQRDIPYFQQLGINLIRVYQVNASLDHSACMSALNSAGVYVLLDLATPAPNDAISSTDPSWNVGLLTNFISTIEAFGSYSNILGFNVGNEVISNAGDDDAAPYIKAGVRDIKAYLKAHNYSQLVGYTATDSPNSRVALPYYLACENTTTSIDYWGVNIYEWCGNSSFTQSGYQARTEELASLGVPAFFSEYGCNQVEPRPFTEVAVLYGSEMTPVWSGGIVYEYNNQTNNYGLVDISADGQSITTTQDFTNLKNSLAGIAPANQSLSSYTPTIAEPVSCPASNSSWLVSTNLPYTPDNSVCECVVNQLSCLSTYTDATDLGTVGTMIGTVCGESSTACSAISGNGSVGVYGDLSYCAPLQQLNIALDTYYEDQSRNAQACDFGGLATVQSSGKPTAASCLAAGFASGIGIPSPTSVAASATTHPIVSSTSGSSGSGSKSAAGSVHDLPLTALFGVLLSVLAGAGGAAMIVF
ncbi:beta-1,3-glucanosyltransferase [Sparassis latifolia]